MSDRNDRAVPLRPCGRAVRTAVLVSVYVATQTTFAFAAGSITLNPTSLTVCAAAANSKPFNASHGNFTQTATSANTSIATVTPPGSTGGNVTYTVTGHATGSTTISLSDTQGATGSEAVSVNGPLMVDKPTLTFNGTTAPQTISVTDTGPAILVSATSSDTTVAMVTAQVTTTSNTATFTVTPVNGSKNGTAPASTTLTFTDAAGCTAKTVSVTVTPGALTLDKTSLSFAGTGATAQSFTASETDYTGLLNAVSANASVASVTPPSGSGPGPVSFNVSPTGFGTTSITVTDNHSGSKAVSVLVSGGSIAIPGSTNASFIANDNTNAHLPASPIRVTGSLQTTGTGSAQIAVVSPGNISGAHGGSLLIGYLTYNCTANGAGNDQGGSFAPGFLQLIAGTQASSCVTFPSNQFATLDLNVNLFMDDRPVAADTYTGNGFQVVLTAT